MKVRLFLVVVALALLVASCSRTDVPQLEELSTETVANSYLVVLNERFTPGGHAANQARAAEIARNLGVQPEHTYGSALFGFSATIPQGRLNALQRDPQVAYVEQDQIAHIASQTVPTGISRIFADKNENLSINGTDEIRIDVNVAVLDTGIYLGHDDLNVRESVDCSARGRNPFATPTCGSGGNDGNGHGTHVAGTIAAIDNGIGVVGVAPGALLWNVKVLGDDGSGTIAAIVAGIDYVTANADKIEVANMSLGCECSSAAMNTAISNSVAAGVVYVVAAGNSNKDASTFSPANHPDVITVSALADFNGEPGGGAQPTCRSDTDDTLANFSNYGSLVDIAAPGVCILSTWHDGGYHTISGTSMASPHAAGAAALLASKNKPKNKTDVFAIRKTLKETGDFNWVWTNDSGNGIEQPLLDVSDESVFAPATVSGSDEGDPGDPDTTGPTASFNYSCNNGSTCSFTDTSTQGSTTITSWSWSFANANPPTSSAQNPSATFQTAGTHTVQLTVTDGNNLSDTATRQIACSQHRVHGMRCN